MVVLFMPQLLTIAIRIRPRGCRSCTAGEFDQKGTVRTKYGTKDQLLEAIQACKRAGLMVYLDTVFNHKFGADEMEQVCNAVCDLIVRK